MVYINFPGLQFDLFTITRHLISLATVDLLGGIGRRNLFNGALKLGQGFFNLFLGKVHRSATGDLAFRIIGIRALTQADDGLITFIRS